MIRLHRKRAANVLHRNFGRDKIDEFEEELLLNQRKISRNELEKHLWVSSRWKAAKEQLLEESEKKCGYCEVPTSVVSYGDVEHYRPKSIYWWLAYSYENYVASCTICNQKYKSASFPIVNALLPAPNVRAEMTDDEILDLVGTLAPNSLSRADIEQFTRMHMDERPLILNPYFDEPKEFIGWEADATKEEVALIPLPENPLSERVCASLKENLGLNRIELLELRWQVYEGYWTLRLAIDDPGISRQTQVRIDSKLKKLKEGKSIFAGMIRYFDEKRFEDLEAPI